MAIEELVAENDKLKRQLAYESTALTMMKADYENRLKADMVAMLEEIQLEIDEMPMHYDPRDVSNLIQQKINALKEQNNDSDN